MLRSAKACRISLGSTETSLHGISEKTFVPPVIESARVINVNIGKWSVDCISTIGGKRFYDIQVMSPYFHYYAGEGIYVMPEVGSLCWVCRPSSGIHAPAFVLGFQAPFDTTNVGYRAGRQNLNPGDIMLRTRDDNFVILRRGGVLQIGATSIAQRFFLPIGNFIRDICENYELNTLGGKLSWLVERTEETTTGDALTKLHLLAKAKANDPEHIASLSIGSHGEGNPVTLELAVNESGAAGAKRKVLLQVTAEGKVLWDLEGDWEITTKKKLTVKAIGDASLSSDGNFSIAALKKLSATGADVLFESTTSTTLESKGRTRISSTTETTIDGQQVMLGKGAVSPLIKGDALIDFLVKLIAGITTAVSTAPGTPIAAPAVAQLAGELSKLLSAKSKTE